MNVVEGYNFNKVYKQLINLFQTANTRTISPRGRDTTEIVEPVTWTILDPADCWLTIPGRKLNPFFAAAEIMWILTGMSAYDPWIKFFNKNMGQFLDDSNYFNAAYGQRIFRYPKNIIRGDPMSINQVRKVVRRIIKDPNTRRAVIGIFDPRFDHGETNDVACNLSVHFMYRDGKLNTHIYQRSNDVVWGTPYNMLQFQHLALLVMGELRARGLNVKRGTHSVTIGSLHVYEDLYKETLDVLFDSRGLTTEQRPVGLLADDSITYTALVDEYTKLLRFLHDQSNPKHTLPPQLLRVQQLGKAPGYWNHLFYLLYGYMCVRNGWLFNRVGFCETLQQPFQWLARDFWKDKL